MAEASPDVIVNCANAYGLVFKENIHVLGKLGYDLRSCGECMLVTNHFRDPNYKPWLIGKQARNVYTPSNLLWSSSGLTRELPASQTQEKKAS